MCLNISLIRTSKKYFQKTVHYADLCAKELGCDEEQDVLACMQSRDIKDIIKSMTYIMGGNPKYIFDINQLKSISIQAIA